MRTQKKCMGYVVIVVADYDRVIDCYSTQLGFTVYSIALAVKKIPVTSGHRYQS